MSVQLSQIYEECCENTKNSEDYSKYKGLVIRESTKIYENIINKYDIHKELLKTSKKGLTSLILYEGDNDYAIIKKVKQYFESYFYDSEFIVEVHEKTFTEKNLIEVVMSDKIYYIIVKWNITPKKQHKSCAANLEYATELIEITDKVNKSDKINKSDKSDISNKSDISDKNASEKEVKINISELPHFNEEEYNII